MYNQSLAGGAVSHLDKRPGRTRFASDIRPAEARLKTLRPLKALCCTARQCWRGRRNRDASNGLRP